jgi:beta propeller repeat protein
MRLVFTGLIILGLGILLIAPTQAVVDEKEYKSEENSEIMRHLVLPGKPGAPETDLQESKTPKYAPGEVLVGLKEGVSIEDVLKNVAIEPKSLGRVYDIKPAVNKFRKELKLEKDSEGWFWFLGKNYKEVEEIPDGELFKEAYKSMPEVEKKLYRSYKINLPQDLSVEEAVAKLKENPDIEYAEPNYLVEALFVPNDPYYHSQGSWGQPYDDLWGLKKIQCERAWDISQGEGVVVAVIDTGIDYNHEDLAGNIWTNPGEIPNNGIDDDGNGYIDDVHGFDFAYSVDANQDGDYNDPGDVSDSDPMDGDGHGTHCAGIIAAVGNNLTGVIGVAPKAKVMAVKGLDDSGSGYLADLAVCLKYAADNGAKVLSNSWGTANRHPTLLVIEEAIDYAYEKGCVIVFAAGNSSDDVKWYSPANYSKTIAVAASTQRDERCFFSNYGVLIDVAAPGGGYENELGGGWDDIYNILSTMPDNPDEPNLKVSDGYWRLAGTSMACPYVSGLAALVLSRRPGFTNEEVRQVLRTSADDLETPGFDLNTGTGRINASKALSVDSVLRVKIAAPAPYSSLGSQTNLVTITGTVTGADLRCYQLFFAPIFFEPETHLGNWTSLGSMVYFPVEDGILGTWDIEKLPVGCYVLKLLAITSSGFQFQDLVEVTIERGIRQITTSSAGGMNPAISGNYIVWADDRNGNFDVYLYDLATNTERQITANPAQHYFPAISGNYIVWADDRNGNFDVYLYDLATNTERQLTNNSVNVQNLAISGNYIVWSDYRNADKDNYANWDIYLYDLATNTERQITTNPAKQDEPAISGNYIVWADYRNNYWCGDIYLYDLATNTERQITTNSEEQLRPAISGNRIVWADYRNGNGDIYLYDLATNTERQITTNPAQHFFPAISGNYIVYTDHRNDKVWGDIYLYDLATNTERQITANYKDQDMPAISGNRIVWQDYRNNTGDIYLYIIPRNPPCGSFGDVDLDGYVTQSDAEMVTQYDVGLITLTDEQKRRADVNHDRSVDAVDALFILQYAQDLRDTFPVCDTTLSSTPAVRDQGTYTPGSTSLSASWSSYDAESGIAEYQYAIGTSKGATNVAGWTSVGTATSVTKTGLKLVNGKIYYFSVKAKNGAGLWSKVGYSAGVELDSDKDGFSDRIEKYIGTNPYIACGYNAWPPDFNNDRVVNILDANMFKGRIGTKVGDPNYSRRFDLNADGVINSMDVLFLKPYMDKRCK